MQKDGKKEFVNSSIEVLLTTEMGFFSDLKDKQIRFNPRPFSKPQHTQHNLDSYVDLHIDVARKVDEVINRNETGFAELQPETSIDFVEIRKNWMKKPNIPEFKTDLQGNPILNEIKVDEDLFEVELPQEIRSDLNIGANSSYENSLLPDAEKLEEEYENTLIEKESSQKWLMGLGKIKVRSKNTTNQEKTTKTKTENRNGVTVVKKDLELAKQEIEKKQKEIEEMQRLAKEKEEELEKKKYEKKFKEKLKQKELREKEKLEKIKQKELLKETKLQEIQKQKELEEKERLEKIKQKELLKKTKLQEIQKQKELKEKEKLEKQKEKEKLKQQKVLLAKENKVKKQEKLKEERLAKEEKIKQKLLEQKPKKSKKEAKEPEQKHSDLIDIRKDDDLIEKSVDETLEAKTEAEEVKKAPEVEPEDIKIQEPAEVKAKVTETTEVEVLDEDVRKALVIIDTLLEKLPEETIDEFINSEDFAIYEKVVNKYTKK